MLDVKTRRDTAENLFLEIEKTFQTRDWRRCRAFIKKLDSMELALSSSYGSSHGLLYEGESGLWSALFYLNHDLLDEEYGPLFLNDLREGLYKNGGLANA